MALQVLKFAWADVAHLAQQVIPPLTVSQHKGSMGRIGVIGGSIDYSGAPYYAAISALKMGADLSWVYCSQAAAVPIKSYSPELIVVPFYEDNVVFEMDYAKNADEFTLEATKAIDIVANSPRVHVFLIGPSLGRHPNVIYIVGNIIHGAKTNDMPMVIDADGLWLVTHNLKMIVGCTSCILTPNKPEFERLIEAAIQLYTAKLQQGAADEDRSFHTALLRELCLVESDKPASHGGSNSPHVSLGGVEGAPSTIAVRRVNALSAALGGVTIMRKGAMDIIASSLGTPLRRNGYSDDDTIDGVTNVESHSNRTAEYDLTAPRQGEDGNAQGVRTASSFADSGGMDVVYVVQAKGSPRRCGGLGDILSGTTAAALHWALERKGTLPESRELAAAKGVHTTSYTFDPTQGDFNASFRAEQDGLLHSGSVTSDGRRVRNAAVHACILASVVSKKAAELAFARKGRAMTAPDVVEQIGAAFQEIHPEG